jgi:hypothetical protein
MKGREDTESGEFKMEGNIKRERRKMKTLYTA